MKIITHKTTKKAAPVKAPVKPAPKKAESKPVIEKEN